MEIKKTTFYNKPGFLESWGEALSSSDENFLSSFYSTDAVYEECAAQNRWEGLANIVKFYNFMFAFSPDCKIKFTSITGNENSFAAEWVSWGTATGKLKFDRIIYPETNLPYSINGIAFCNFNKDNLITIQKDYYDVRSLLKQLSLFSIQYLYV